MLPAFLSTQLSYLNYFNLGRSDFPGLITDNSIAFKTGASAYFANRVCGSNNLNLEDVNKIEKFYGQLPFTWWVDENQSELIATLESNNFAYRCSYPAMSMNLGNFNTEAYRENISVKLISNNSEINDWIKIVVESYSLKFEDMQKFTHYILENADSSKLKLYIGYYGNIPAATSMAMMYDDAVALHWVGTIAQYRNKGLGYAVTCQPMLEAKNNNIKSALLFASVMGKPLYEKIGFKQYLNYHVYGHKS